MSNSWLNQQIFMLFFQSLDLLDTTSQWIEDQTRGLLLAKQLTAQRLHGTELRSHSLEGTHRLLVADHGDLQCSSATSI